MIDATQTWFWTAAWQRGEREAAEELARGAGERFESGDELLTALRAEVHDE